MASHRTGGFVRKILASTLVALAPAAALASTPGQVDSGDTAIVLVSAGLVLLMTPGLAFFYGGLVRAKNVVHTMILSLVCMALVGVLWALVSYSLAFAPGPAGLDRFIGGLSFLGLRGVGGEVAKDLAPTVPHAAFMLFQAMFAVITPALISGAIVERVRIKAFVLFVGIWSIVVYAPVAHWVWAPGGWLRQLGALDFAGGTVVHINAAAAALVFAIVLGRRRGLKQPSVLPHNVPFAILGAGLLWFGWLGFNGGSALAANGLAAYAFSNTFFAPAAAALAAGLASLTAVRFRPRLGLDDSLDVFAVHGVAATLGALLTGVLASKVVNPDGADGSLHLLGVQAVGVLATYLWSGGLSYGIMKLVDLVTPLRALEQDEWGGMDIAESGERAYITADESAFGQRAEPAPAHAPELRHAAAK